MVPTPEALLGPGSPGLGGCPRRPPSFRTYVADASLRAMSGGTWRATDSATLRPLTVSGRNLRRTLPGGGRNTEEGMSSHPPGRLGGGAQSGAGAGTEGAGLGAGQGWPVTAGPGRGVWGTAHPTLGGRAAGSGTPAARVCGRLGVQEQRRVAGGRGNQRASNCATAQHRWTCARGAGALPLGSVRRSGVQAVHRLG